MLDLTKTYRTRDRAYTGIRLRTLSSEQAAGYTGLYTLRSVSSDQGGHVGITYTANGDYWADGYEEHNYDLVVEDASSAKVDVAKIRPGDKVKFWVGAEVLRITDDPEQPYEVKINAEHLSDDAEATDDDYETWAIGIDDILEHTSAPYVPKIGDLVTYGEGSYRVGGIDGDRVWLPDAPCVGMTKSATELRQVSA